MYNTNLCTQNYQRPQLTFLYLKGARDKAQCPEQVGKCLATQLYSWSSAEKLHLNQFQACTEIPEQKDCRWLKLPPSNLASDVQILTQNHKK
jgi:hypothetical protein